MLLPAVKHYFFFVCCKVMVVFHLVQDLGLNVVANGPKLMANNIFTLAREAVVIAFCFLDD